jgi:FKBP-type peptidyl-prolyl cis-trans isomerase (trigger factor)
MFKYHYQHNNVYRSHIIHICVANVKIIIKIGGENMDKDKELLEIARTLRNEKVKEWRNNNKDKIKEINRRYWLKKAKQHLAEQENKTKEVE